MPATMKSLGIDRLPIGERLSLLEELWDSISDDPDGVALTEAQEALIAQRLAEHRENPDDVIPWEVIRAEAEARLSR